MNNILKLAGIDPRTKKSVIVSLMKTSKAFDLDSAAAGVLGYIIDKESNTPISAIKDVFLTYSKHKLNVLTSSSVVSRETKQIIDFSIDNDSFDQLRVFIHSAYASKNQ